MGTIDRFGVGIFGLLAACLLATAPLARAGDPAATPTRLLLGPGSVVEGSPVGNVVASPQRLVYGEAGWAMNVLMENHIRMLVAEGGIGVYEGQLLPSGDTVTQLFGYGLDSDLSGHLAAVVGVNSTSSAVTIDDAVVLHAGDGVPAAGLQAGSTWASLHAVDFDPSGHLAVLGTVIEPSAPGSPIDALVLYDVEAGGALSAPVVLLSEHDVVAGHALAYIASLTDLNFARNDAGQLVSTVRFVAASGPGPGPDAIVLDGAVLAEDGKPSLVPGRDWIVDLNDPVALNAQGSLAYRTKISGPFDGLEILVHDGAIVAVEGNPLPGLPATKITRLHAPRLADDGTLLVLVEWTEGSNFTYQGFLVDGQLAVATTVTQIEGETLAGFHNDKLLYDLSADGTRFVFVGFSYTCCWGVYEAPTGPWQDLTGSLAGSGGVAPTLFALGSLEGGAAVSLELAGAVPGSVTHLVIGLSQVNVPFHGGVLVPSPDVLLLGLPVNAEGALALTGALPAGLPSSVPLHFQFWTADAGAPDGYSASNCLVGLTP